MTITEVGIKLIHRIDSRVKAFATIIIDDCLVIHDIKVTQNRNQLYISMPSKKLPNGEYKDIVHPLNTETRESLRNIILSEYQKVVDEYAAQQEESSDNAQADVAATTQPSE